MPEASKTSDGPGALTVHDAGREVIEFIGPDAGTFLHSQFAQDLSHLTVGGSVHSLLLEPTGHLVALTRVTRADHDRWLVDADAGVASSVVARLERFVLRAKVTIAASDMGCVAVRGPGARRWAAAHADREVVHGVTWWDRDGSDGGSCDLIGPRGSLPTISAPPGSLEPVRADAGWPRVGVDLEPGDLPATTGLLAVAVSFAKGCYPGQELAERMDSRAAGPPVELRTIAAGAARAGDDVMVGTESAGRITSVGASRAIARIKRGHDIGSPLGPAPD